MKYPIYLDNQSTTPCDPRVIDKMLPYFTEKFGNSSSVSHVYGRDAQAAVAEAQKHVASLIGADDPKSIFFTSGSTESNNIAVKSVMLGSPAGTHCITTAAEHKAILDPFEFLKTKEYRTSTLPVDQFGRVSKSDIANSIEEETLLVSTIFANNEIGTINDINQISQTCKDHDLLLHTDATQAVGRTPINCVLSNIDMLSLSGHKLYGPKGIGALYIRKRARGIKLEPLLHGGGHQGKVRSGTLPVALIVGLGEACRIAKDDYDKDFEHSKKLSQIITDELTSMINGIQFNGHPTERITTNVHATIPGVNSEALIHLLKDKVAFSTGAACTTAAPEPSHVLLAIGKSKEAIKSSFRIGIGRFSSQGEIKNAITYIAEAANSLLRFK